MCMTRGNSQGMYVAEAELDGQVLLDAEVGDRRRQDDVEG